MKNIINILDYICTGEDVLKGVDAMRMEYIFIKPADEYEAKKNWDRYFSDKLSAGQIMIRLLSWQISLKRCLENV